MSETLAVGNWFVGSNGNLFADMGGFRYCVSLIEGRNNASGYMVARNGIVVAGPTCLSGQAGFKTVDAAKQYAEWNADSNEAQRARAAA